MNKTVRNSLLLFLCLSIQKTLPAQTANAAITVHNEYAGFGAATTSKHKGAYALVRLPLRGHYAIIGSAGFAPERRTGFAPIQGNMLQVGAAMKNKVQNRTSWRYTLRCWKKKPEILVDKPYFTLSNAGDRGVYVPAESTGAFRFLIAAGTSGVAVC